MTLLFVFDTDALRDDFWSFAQVFPVNEST